MVTNHLADGLVAENARLRARLDEALANAQAYGERMLQAQNERDHAKRELVKASGMAAQYAQKAIENGQRADRIEQELATANAKLHAAAMVKVWTNEYGKRFVFADDLTDALLPEYAGQRREDTTAGTP